MFKKTRAVRSAGVAVLSMVLWLSACGGGEQPTEPPTALPPTLVVTVPATQQALGARIVFASNATDPKQSLSYLWEFGDGATSTLANPEHSYAKPGVYALRFTLQNEAGERKTITSSVTVADLAIVQGKLCSGADSTGWCWQRPLPQGNAINDYAFVDDTHGWAVGEQGTVLVTSDAGATWRAQVSGTDLNLTKLAFVDAQIGWVGATNGELLKTSDGGATWRRVSFGRDETVLSLGASDANNVWLTGASGRVLASSDGGTTWREIVGPSGVGYTGLVPVSGSEIWAAPPAYLSGAIQHSVDGGANWASVALPALETGLNRYFSSAQFLGGRRALMVGNEYGYLNNDTSTFVSRQVAWQSSDGGTTWQVFNPPSSAPYASNWSYALIGVNTVLATDVYGGALTRYTNDAGATWQTVNLPATESGAWLTGFRAFSASRFMVQDNQGRAYLSTDGGAHWAQSGAGRSAGPTLNSVWFFDSREGLAMSDDGSGLRTADGGQTWLAASLPGVYVGWRRAQFAPNGALGWVISDSGAIYRSTDKGKTWVAPVLQTSTALTGVTDFHFIDELHGWAVSPNAPYIYPPTSSGGTIYRTSNGGLSWEAVTGTATSVQGMVSLRFADATHGLAVGAAGVAMVTADGGGVWSPRPTGVARALRSVTFVDANIAAAVGEGGTIVRSTDQGQTWVTVPSPTANTLNEVRFLSASVGYAVGDYGTLLFTRDGGLTWSLQRTGASAGLRSAFFIDEQTGWAVGNNGSILATVSGGR